jgi:hypothetical protein
MHFLDLAGYQARLAIPAVAVAAAVIQGDAGAQGGFQKGVVAFHEELVAGGLHGDLDGHDAHHAFLCQQRFRPFRLAWGGFELALEPLFESGHGLHARRATRFRHVAELVAQEAEHFVVMQKQALGRGEFLAQLVQTLRQHFLVRQGAFVHALAEGLGLDLLDPLEFTVVFPLHVGEHAQEFVHVHHAVEGGELAVMDHALDGGTGLANQAGDTGNGKVMGHGLHNSQPLPWQQNSAREYLKMLNLAVRPYREHAYQALRQAGLPALLARLFAARGIAAPAEMKSRLAELLPVGDLKNAEAAGARLADAIARQEKLLVVADYDADGATACAVAMAGLSALGARVDYLVPNRFEYGYGLSPEIVRIAAERAPDLLITVDNGIAAHAGIEEARRLGHGSAGHRPPPAGRDPA